MVLVLCATRPARRLFGGVALLMGRVSRCPWAAYVVVHWPVPGVHEWLGAAMASTALCWMLRALVPMRWALAGGLAATHVSMIDFTQSFTRVAFRLRSVGSGHCAVVGALALRLDPTE